MKAQQQEKEFIALVEEYKQVIYKVCYIYASDPENLNDLYQEVVINLWKAFPRFRGECKASTWKRWQRKKIKRLNFMSSTG